MRQARLELFSPGWLGRFIPLITALTAIAALVYSGKSLQATESSTQKQYSLAQQGQVADRFNKAVEHLGETNSLAVRLGGIYSLEQIARDSPPEQPTVIDVLAAYVRSHARIPADGNCGSPPAPIDIQAAVTVLGRHTLDRSEQHPVDLSRVCLTGIDFRGLHLHKANLRTSVLSDSTLADVDLSEADLSVANLSSSSAALMLAFALPTFTVGYGVNLAGADLGGANLFAAPLAGADLHGASLDSADLSLASLSGAKHGLAMLRGTKFTGAQLDRADLSHATYDDQTTWPAAFLPPPSATKCQAMQPC